MLPRRGRPGRFVKTRQGQTPSRSSGTASIDAQEAEYRSKAMRFRWQANGCPQVPNRHALVMDLHTVEPMHPALSAFLRRRFPYDFLTIGAPVTVLRQDFRKSANGSEPPDAQRPPIDGRGNGPGRPGRLGELSSLASPNGQTWPAFGSSGCSGGPRREIAGFVVELATRAQIRGMSTGGAVGRWCVILFFALPNRPLLEYLRPWLERRTPPGHGAGHVACTPSVPFGFGSLLGSRYSRHGCPSSPHTWPGRTFRSSPP